MKKLNKLLSLIMFACFLVAIIMIFVPAVKIDSIMFAEKSYNGLKIIFGYTSKNNIGGGLNYEAEVFKFSFMNLLTYILVLVALLLTCMEIVKNSKKASIVTYVTILCAIVAGVFFFLTRNFVVVSDSVKKGFDTAKTTFAKEAELGAGSIIGGVTCLLGGLCGAAKVILPKLK